MASRGTGLRSRGQPAAAPQPRRPHTPRSHVFSGVPPPDLHMLNMQKTVDDLRQQNAELTRKLESSQAEATHLRQAVARQARGDVVGGLSHTPATSPFPFDDVLQTHVTKLQELAGAEAQPTSSADQSLAALTRFYETLEGRFATNSTEVLTLTAELAAVRARCAALEEQALERTADPAADNGAVEVQAARVVASGTFSMKASSPTSESQSLHPTDSINSQDASRPGSATGSGRERLGKSASGSIIFPSRNRSGASLGAGSVSSFPPPQRALPDDLLEKLKQVSKVHSQPSCVAYVKKLKEVLRRHGLSEDEKSSDLSGLHRAQTAKVTPFPRPATQTGTTAASRSKTAVERSFSSGPHIKTLQAARAPPGAAMRSRSRSPVNAA